MKNRNLFTVLTIYRVVKGACKKPLISNSTAVKYVLTQSHTAPGKNGMRFIVAWMVIFIFVLAHGSCCAG